MRNIATCTECGGQAGNGNGFIIDGLCAPCWSDDILTELDDVNEPDIDEPMNINEYAKEIAHLNVKPSITPTDLSKSLNCSS